jgi:hypothetical protein
MVPFGDDTADNRDATQLQSFENSNYDLDQIHNFSSGHLNLTNHAIQNLGGTMNKRSGNNNYFKDKTNPLCNLSNISHISMHSEPRKQRKNSSK